MRKKRLKLPAYKRFEKLIVIAFFFSVAATCTVYAGTPPTDMQNTGVILTPIPTPPTPVWGKLVVSGNTVTCFYANGIAAPKTWTQIGQPQTINFINNPVLVGLYLTTNQAGVVGSGTIDNFSITPTPSYQLADYDIGGPPLMGAANLISGVWYLSGSGNTMWGTSDQCNFQSWLVWGDCTVICRATAFTSTPVNQRMGIMIRDGFNSGSDCALFAVRRAGGVEFEYRLKFNNNADITEYVAPPAPGVKSSVAVGYGLTGGTSYTVRP